MDTDDGGERLTRVEHELDHLRTDVRILLRTQVLEKDQLDEHGTRLNRIEAPLERLIEHGHKLYERIDKLVSAIGRWSATLSPGLIS